jgi:hypothetical protein
MSIKLGALDRAALEALRRLVAVLDDDDWFQDIIEDLAVQTDPRAAMLVDSEQEADVDAFFEICDEIGERVAARAAKALYNMTTNRSDRLVRLLNADTQEKAMQT